MIRHYFTISLRNLLRYKTQTLVSIIGVAIGISCFSLVNSLITAALDKPYSDYPDYDRIFKVYRIADSTKIAGGEEEGSADDADKGEVSLKSNCIDPAQILCLDGRTIPQIASYFYYGDYLDAQNNEMAFIDKAQMKSIYLVKQSLVSRSFFSFNHCKLLYGKRIPKQPSEIVISKSFALKAFGKRNPVGFIATRVENDTLPPLTIVNVMEDAEMDNIKSDIYQCDVNKSCYMQIYGTLARGSSLAQLNQNLSQVKSVSYGRMWHLQAQLVRDEKVDGKDVLIISILTLLSGLILFSGLINVLKFSVQLFHNRQSELALRRSMGSDTRGLWMLLLSDIVWMLTLSLLLSFIITEGVFYCFKDFDAGFDIPAISLSTFIWRQLYTYLALLLLCMVIILIPVKYMRHVSLQSQIHRQQSHRLPRYLAIASQLTIGIFFLGVSAGLSLLIGHITDNAAEMFDKKESSTLLSVMPNTLTLKHEMPTITALIKQLPQVEDVLVLQNDPSYGLFQACPYERHNGTTSYISTVEASPNYFDFMHIPYKGGAPAVGNIYVSKELNSFLQQENVNGNITIGESNYRIAGQYDKLKGEQKTALGKGETAIGSALIPVENGSYLIVRARSGVSTEELKKAITKVCRRFVPETLPLSISTIRERYTRNIDKTIILFNTISSLLALIAMLLVVASIYSSISMDTMRRSKEIAIRKINGATPRDIAHLFARPYLIILVASYLFALPAIYFFANGLFTSSSQYHPLGLVHLVLLFVTVAFVVASTLFYRIVCIMHINPAEVIKRQ